MSHQEPEPRSDDEPEVDLAAIHIVIIDRPEAYFSLSWDAAWIVYKVLQAVGIEDSFHFARSMVTGASVAKEGMRARLHFDDDFFYQVWEEVAAALHATDDYGRKTEMDRVVHFTYVLLRGDYINREHAAAIASQILQQHVTPEAWRKRMERWAHAHGLPPVRRKRGRKPKYNLDTFGYLRP